MKAFVDNLIFTNKIIDVASFKMKNSCFIYIFSVMCAIWFLRMASNKNVHDKNYNIFNNRQCKDIFLPNNTSERDEMVSEIDFEYSYDYKKLLECFNLDEKRFFHMPFVSYITHEKWIFQAFANHIYAKEGSILDPDSVNCGDLIYVKTDFIEDFFETYHKQIKNPYILMTQESDFKIGYPWQMEILNDPKIIKWFAINVIGKHPKLEPIPCGFAPPLGKNFSTIYNMSKNLTPYYNRSTLLYLSFSPYIQIRKTALEYFKNVYKNNTNIEINEKWIDWSQNLSHLGNAKFVLSPPGNGIDPHRTWEALSMGAVPIVLNQSEFQSLFDDMPVMVVNDWTEVTEENMEKFISQRLVNNFSKDGIPWRPKLWLRYWIVKIMSEKYNYIKQFC